MDRFQLVQRSNAAIRLRDAGKFKQADQAMQAIQSDIERVLGPDSLDLSDIMKSRAISMFMQEKWHDVVEMISRANDLISAISPDHVDIARNLDYQCQAEWLLCRFTEAEASAKRAMKIMKKEGMIAHPKYREFEQMLPLIRQKVVVDQGPFGLQPRRVTQQRDTIQEDIQRALTKQKSTLRKRMDKSESKASLLSIPIAQSFLTSKPPQDVASLAVLTEHLNDKPFMCEVLFQVIDKVSISVIVESALSTNNTIRWLALLLLKLGLELLCWAKLLQAHGPRVWDAALRTVQQKGKLESAYVRLGIDLMLGILLSGERVLINAGCDYGEILVNALSEAIFIDANDGNVFSCLGLLRELAPEVLQKYIDSHAGPLVVTWFAKQPESAFRWKSKAFPTDENPYGEDQARSQLQLCCGLLSSGLLELNEGTAATLQSKCESLKHASGIDLTLVPNCENHASTPHDSNDPVGPAGQSKSSKFLSQLNRKTGLRLCSNRGCCKHEQLGQPRFKLCSGCSQVVYCSTECQRQDWKDRHKNVCPKNYHLSSSIAPHDSISNIGAPVEDDHLEVFANCRASTPEEFDKLLQLLLQKHSDQENRWVCIESDFRKLATEPKNKMWLKRKSKKFDTLDETSRDPSTANVAPSVGLKSCHGSDFSQTSSVSLVSAAIEGPRCFLSDSLLHVDKGSYIKAGDLKLGSQVLAASGKKVSVVGVTLYEDAEQELVELSTETAVLTVTVSHRVLVQRRSGPQTLSAGALKVDDDVFIGGGLVEKLRGAIHFSAVTGIVDLTFSPDESVEAFHPVRPSILSKGHGEAKTRRGKRSKDINPMVADNLSIPDTENSFS